MRSNLLALLGLSLLVSCTSLPSPPVTPRRAPPTAKTPIEVCWIETGGTTVPAGFGAGGITTSASWEVTTSALLIRHPQGDVLLDTGMSPNAESEAQELGPWKRFVFNQTAGKNATRGALKSKLDELGVAQLHAIVISHAHADHLGGVAQLPDVPVWLANEELAFIRSDLKTHGGVVIPAQGRALEGRSTGLKFRSGPFLNFPSSHDVFGDGSIVIVPTFGHTPGSVATFINMAGHPLLHVGDLINLEESISRGVPKSLILRALTDEDAAATDLQVARLIDLHRAAPEIQILPAHDRAVWERLFGPSPIGAPPPCIKAD